MTTTLQAQIDTLQATIHELNAMPMSVQESDDWAEMMADVKSTLKVAKAAQGRQMMRRFYGPDGGSVGSSVLRSYNR